MLESDAFTPVVLFLSREEADLAQSLFSRMSPSAAEPECPAPTVKSTNARDVATWIYSARRDRRHFFAEDLFADPAWDMLMALYCAEAGGKEMSVTSLIYAVAIPQTTGLRWVAELERRNLVLRAPHCTDRRSLIVKLTDEARLKLGAYLERAAEKRTSLRC